MLLWIVFISASDKIDMEMENKQLIFYLISPNMIKSKYLPDLGKIKDFICKSTTLAPV